MTVGRVQLYKKYNNNYVAYVVNPFSLQNCTRLEFQLLFRCLFISGVIVFYETLIPV